jgi:hypothetical protein
MTVLGIDHVGDLAAAIGFFAELAEKIGAG